VQESNHPRVLLLQIGNTSFKVSKGHLKIGENSKMMAKTHILHIQAVHANLIFKSGSHFKIMDLHFWFLHGQNYMYSESEEVLSRVLLKR